MQDNVFFGKEPFDKFYNETLRLSAGACIPLLRIGWWPPALLAIPNWDYALIVLTVSYVARQWWHHRSEILQFVSKSHKDGFHMVWLWVVLCWCFEQWHVVCISKLLCHIGAHRDFILHITFVSDQDAGNIICQLVPITFLDPLWHIVKWLDLCDIIDKHNSMHITVIVRYHTLTETFLSCCIPELKLKTDKTKFWLAYTS